jgi:hypothetical protein
MNCATAACTQGLVTALLLQVSNDCVDAAADVLAVVLCRCLCFPACSSRRQFPIASKRCDYALKIPAGSALHAATPTLGFCLMKFSQMRGAPLLKSRNSGIWHLASGIWHLVNLPLLSHNNKTMPLRVFTRRHYNVLEAGATIRGGWRVVGASPGYPPK